MPETSRRECLQEISEELARFRFDLAEMFRCPTCFRDYEISSSQITEEHIIPEARGGKVTTFLCRSCNSVFGHKQTRCLSDWIEINEGGAPFHLDPKKQRAKITADGITLNGSMKIANDGAIEFYTDRRRSNPKDFDSHWEIPKPSKVKITTSVPVFADEMSLEAGFLTAAYGLWFKNFGYSFVLQSNLNIVRQQMREPNKCIMSWNFLIEAPSRDIVQPCIGLMRFNKEYFPIAVIYDHIVLLPSAKHLHPRDTPENEISKKILSLGDPLVPRYQHRCVGPAVLICDGQEVIQPDIIPNPTVLPQYVEIAGW